MWLNEDPLKVKNIYMCIYLLLFIYLFLLLYIIIIINVKTQGLEFVFKSCSSKVSLGSFLFLENDPM